jgi:sec-independent protein translocase protein TatA
MFSNIGSGEIIVVLLVLLFLFGGNKLPELARGLGESSKELKRAKREIHDVIQDVTKDEEPKNIPSQEGPTEGGEPQ